MNLNDINKENAIELSKKYQEMISTGTKTEKYIAAFYLKRIRALLVEMLEENEDEEDN